MTTERTMKKLHPKYRVILDMQEDIFTLHLTIFVHNGIFKSETDEECVENMYILKFIFYCEASCINNRYYFKSKIIHTVKIKTNCIY